MPPERRRGEEDEQVREIRLEGAGLWIAGAVAVAVLLATVQIGRWDEARVGGGSTTALPGVEGTQEGGGTSSRTVSAEEGLTHFDTMEGKVAEPAREARKEPASPAPAAGSAPVAQGPWFVQVFAGRERRSAERLVQQLSDKGYPVRIDSSRDGSEALFRVQVGGFPTREEADPVAARLRDDGFATLVKRID